MKHKPIKYDHGITKCIDCTPEGLEVPKENLGTGLIVWLVTSTTRGSQDRSHMTSNHYIIQIIHIYMHIYIIICIINILNHVQL